MISKKQTTLTFSSVAIAAVITLFASGPLVAAHQAFACGGWGGGWGGGCGCGCGGGWGGWGGPIGVQLRLRRLRRLPPLRLRRLPPLRRRLRPPLVTVDIW